MVIDSHSHVGEDYYFGKIEIKDYIDFCKTNGIDIGFLMPPAWPVYTDKNGNKIVTLLWEHFDYKYKNYFCYFNDSRLGIDSNPYKDVNKIYFDIIDDINESVKLFFIPLVHGILDTPDHVEQMLKEMLPKGIKMHGFGSGFSPEEIKPEITELLRHYDVPLILHTSVYNYNYGYGLDTKFWRNECHPLRWAKYIVDNGLKGVLNHGACLNKESINLVNSYEGLMIGIGPDLDISKDYFKIDLPRTDYEKIGYLKLLKEKVRSNKLLFDIDYNWNRNPGNNDIDYKSIDRISSVWHIDDIKLILSKNAKRFYNI